MAKLPTLTNGFRAVPDGQFIKKLPPMMLAHATRPAVSPLSWNMLIKLLGTAVFGERISIDRFMADPHRMPLQPHASCDLFGRPTCIKTAPNSSHDFGINDQLAMHRTALFALVLRIQRMIPIQFRLIVETTRVALDLAVDRGCVSTQPICDFRHWHLRIVPIGNLASFF